MWQLDSRSVPIIVSRIEANFDPHLRRVLDSSLEIVKRTPLSDQRERIVVNYITLEYGGCGGPATESSDWIAFDVIQSPDGSWILQPEPDDVA